MMDSYFRWLIGVGMHLTTVLCVLLFSVVEYNPRYEAIVAKLQEAVDYGVSGEKCAARYTCSSKS